MAEANVIIKRGDGTTGQYALDDGVYLNVNEIAYSIYDVTGAEGWHLLIVFKGNANPTSFTHPAMALKAWNCIRQCLGADPV